MSSSTVNPLISFDDVTIGYGRTPLVGHIDWQIERGSVWGVVGPNGAGKTTLLRTLLGMQPPCVGSVRRMPDLRFGYVKQRDALNETYPFTVEEVVMMGTQGQRTPFHRAGRDDRAVARRAMEQTGVLELATRPVGELSGGQKQRVLIGRALASSPDVIVLDEPTNDMDLAGEQAVLALLSDIQRETGAAIIMVSHLINVVLQIAHDVVLIRDQRCEIITKHELANGQQLSQVYGMPIQVVTSDSGGYAVLPSRSPTGSVSEGASTCS